MDTISLLPGDILLDDAFNSRQEYPERPEAVEPGQRLNDDQFERSIARHGVIQPPRVRKLADGRYSAVFGFRRIRTAAKLAPDKAILCTVQPPSEDGERGDDRTARMLNLSENLQRNNLRPWEVARALFELQQAHPYLTPQEIADETGLSVQYVRNLIRFRRKAHPSIWKQWQRWGTSLRLPFKEALAIVALPTDRQLAAWNAALEARKSKVGKRGKEKRPGPAKLLKYLHAVDTVKRSSEFRRGLKKGLRIALGKERFESTGDSPAKKA